MKIIDVGFQDYISLKRVTVTNITIIMCVFLILFVFTRYVGSRNNVMISVSFPMWKLILLVYLGGQKTRK